MSAQTQKVVIPKGLVNPEETTIVEIPVNLKHLHTVIARPKQDWSFGVNRPLVSDYGSSMESPKITKKTYMRKSFPPLRGRKDMLHEGGVTFGGRPNEEESMMDESSHGFHPYVPKSPCTPNISTYRNFNPNMRAHSTMIEDNTISPVKFRSPPARIPQARMYPKMSPASKAPTPEIYKTSITTSTPEQISTTEITEERYMTPPRAGLPKPPVGNFSLPSPGSDGGSPFDRFAPDEDATWLHEANPLHPDLPANRTPASLYSQSPSRALSTPSSFNDPSTSCDTSCPSSGGNRSLTQSDIMNSLGSLESSEMHKIMGDLSDFQSARRRLVFDASSLASAADVSSSLLQRTI